MRISVSGFKNSGKSTVSDILQQHGYVRLSYASVLKDMVSILFNIDRVLLDGSTSYSRRWREEPLQDLQWLCGHGIFINDVVISPRLLLQRFGTDLFRDHVHSLFWINILNMRCIECDNMYRDGVTLPDNSVIPYRGIVIDDARFVNEMKLCDYNIHIIRQRYSDDDIAEMHISEREHLSHTYDYTIHNTGSIDDLVVEVEQLCMMLKDEQSRHSH